jgi:Spy/CpxP family protein refolding chaperone
MNRRIVVAAVLALSVGAITLLAQGPGQRAGVPGIMPMVHQLDLTEAQRDQIRALAEEGRQDGNPGAAVRSAEQKLHAAVLADTPDLQAIDNLKAALNSAQAQELDRRVEMMRKVAQILTPSQRQQLLQMQPQGPPRGRGPGRH